jgi:hypothetical protein
MPHGVDPFRCPDTSLNARDTGESTSCALSTKIEPDSRAQPPEMTALLKQITSIKVEMLKNTGKVSAVLKGGRSFKVMENGKELTVRISKSRTQITIGGKKAKRDKVKVGMTCEISWLKVNGEANLLACKN